MHELAVTAIGGDQPGIVAAVAKVLHERGGNLEDSAMTILGGHFAIVLLVASEDDPDELREALRDATSRFGLTLSVSRAEGGHVEAAPTHLLSVYGTDHPGIVAGVTGAIADVGANVTDLGTQVIGTDRDPVYAMVIEIAVGDEELLSARLSEVCDELGVDHTLRPIETETY